MTRKPRIAIYGGDERSENLDWPEHLDIQVYPYKSPRSVDRLKESISSGSIDHLVVLTSYVGHGFAEGFKGFANTTRWPRSPGQLSREIHKMFPPPAQPYNPLLVPTRPDHPGTGGGRGPFAKNKEVIVSETTVPIFEHVVAVPPKPDETFGQALTRILKAEALSQTDLARMIGKDASTINGWTKDRGLPKDLGPLVDLWPELARFDKERTYKVAPTATEAEVRTADELKELIRGVKAEPKAMPVPVPSPPTPAPPPVASKAARQDPGRLIGPELAAVMARWRKAKEELETTERYLIILLREAGI